jgi:hypothetical protein
MFLAKGLHDGNEDIHRTGQYRVIGFSAVLAKKTMSTVW